MSDIDPLTSNIEQLQDTLNRPAVASMAGNVASVEVGPDGSLHAIRLTDYGRRLNPDTLVEAILRLHAAALAQARKSVADAVARLENDPRILAQRQRLLDALDQPLPRQPTPPPSSWPDQRSAWTTSNVQQPTQASRQPTPEEEEEMDRYYQRRSWLE